MFGPTLWKSVEVPPCEITVVDPGVIELKYAARGHKVPKGNRHRGRQLGGVTTRRTDAAVDLLGHRRHCLGAHQREAGEHKMLNPAIIALKPPRPRGSPDLRRGQLPVPPGKYTIEVGDQVMHSIW
ncbi:hypothetical protein [Mesorhizobium sp.]|uniref:hypothetical protein n=1 Tax=Mesorhizobium sp. TaxID=1871066 RepID=UPI000FE504FE|nr:hypothetical protein [Mesorhizobium sp.]RWP95735.1 MAG: hypothetical protein EOR89_25515 [Mesorhizobium sp.]